MILRVARRRSILGAAATVSMVSSARRNRAERKAIEQQTNEQAEDQNGELEAQKGGQQTQTVSPQDELTAQLEQLNSLKNQGILTDEEFQAKKKQLLNI